MEKKREQKAIYYFDKNTVNQQKSESIQFALPKYTFIYA
jgi:hypothetical protein